MEGEDRKGGQEQRRDLGSVWGEIERWERKNNIKLLITIGWYYDPAMITVEVTTAGLQ